MGAGKLSGATANVRLTAAPQVSLHPVNVIPPHHSILPTHVQPELSSELNACNVLSTDNAITDIYFLCVTGQPITSKASNPFLTIASLQGPHGERVCFLATVDNGTIINTLDVKAYNSTTSRLLQLSPSKHTLQMADGSLIPSLGVWSGMFEWGQMRCSAVFEIFLSGDSWKMLIGKPLLEQLKAVQDYQTDSIIIRTDSVTDTIVNTTHIPSNPNTLPSPSSPPVLYTSTPPCTFHSFTSTLPSNPSNHALSPNINPTNSLPISSIEACPTDTEDMEDYLSIENLEKLRENEGDVFNCKYTHQITTFSSDSQRKGHTTLLMFRRFLKWSQ